MTSWTLLQFLDLREKQKIYEAMEVSRNLKMSCADCKQNQLRHQMNFSLKTKVYLVQSMIALKNL
ncbi:CLUMA_CG004563, isoform A [Clunio marinus]|uniref:CLUMA_CG004563, isoform A n=1 Tax=Clunio marinus TaxID=568069 RepID=A0A1J1HXK6_9DIPT|nr:CLUMA_CG004563, isoform A [Clunio marinus]